jgi:hypothetical protein
VASLRTKLKKAYRTQYHCTFTPLDQAALAVFERALLTTPDRLARNYVHQMLVIEELTHSPGFRGKLLTY